MNRYVTGSLHDRTQVLKTTQSTKSILDLALAEYLSQTPNADSQRPDDIFQRFAMNQVKLFLFSGHDTTSSSMHYLFYVLAQHPSSVSQMQAEHDKILGADPDDAATMISQNPTILNKLPYTLAVIKETLRLFLAPELAKKGLVSLTTRVETFQPVALWFGRPRRSYNGTPVIGQKLTNSFQNDGSFLTIMFYILSKARGGPLSLDRVLASDRNWL